MSSIEWPSVDTSGVSLPAMVSSTDLFEGELFGDELIDIYNNAVEHSGDSDMADNDIPQLSHHDDDRMIKEDDDEGTKVAITAAAMDDGFGAFRPSTSFSDLTTLLSTDNHESGKNADPTDDQKAAKKRSASLPTSSPPSKRKATTSAKAASLRRVSLTNSKDLAKEARAVVHANSTTAAKQASPAATKQKANTPDPLSLKGKQPVSQPSSALVKKAAVAAPKAAASIAASASDSDFKSIAQAAVSSLITNASSKKSDGDDKKVDTSSEHIKALTGNNWVAACSVTTPAVQPVAATNDPKGNNRARRQNLTADERARQNRDRNREHARNTRLRKKAYVEELKRTLTELVAQRDATDFEKRQTAQREVEQREVRFRVIEEFLKLRGRNESNAARWAAILEEGFSLTMPLTSYRKSVSSCEKTPYDQVLKGVEQVMEDSNFFSTFLQSFHCDASEDKGVVSFQYQCDRSNFFMDGCNAVLEWTAKSVEPESKESKLAMKGLFRGKFSPASNKLISAQLSFDTGLLLSQVPKLSSFGGTAAELAEAQAAANQADAILDSLEMPRIATSVPAAVNVVPSSSSSSETSSDKGDLDFDSEVEDKVTMTSSKGDVTCSED